MEQFANSASSTLNGTISSSVTSLTVASASTFPSSGNFRIIVDSEIMLVTAVSTNTFTVTRGYESTVAASHTSGVAVTHILTAGSLTQAKYDALGVWPSGDTHTLLDYRFNETVQGVLVNHGTYGTASSPVGPAPTTLTAGFTQPSVGSSVTANVSSATGYSSGQLILVGTSPGTGAGANYYYCTGTGVGTLTLKNLGVSTGTGSTYVSPGSTVGANGTSVAPVLDLLFQANTSHVTLMNRGILDYCGSYNGVDDSNYYNYGNNISGGCPDFNGITELSMHVLIHPTKYNNTYMQWFGYANSQTWSTNNFANIVLFSDNGSNGGWDFEINNQSFSNLAVSATGGYGYYTPWTWQLLSVTLNMTTTSSSCSIYKNGNLVGTGNLSATGSLALGSSGFWWIGNPGPGNGDTGDNYQGLYQMARFENTVRSQSYIQAMWNSIVPASVNWPIA